MMKYVRFFPIFAVCAAVNQRRAKAAMSRLIFLGCVAAIIPFSLLLPAMESGFAAEPSSSLAGQWHLAETTDEKNERLKAIDDATGHLGGFRQRKARSILAERTSPPKSLTIELEDAAVTIASDDRRRELALGGSPAELPESDGKGRVSARIEESSLIVTVDAEKAERTTTYFADGDQLTRKVTMTGARLAGALNYTSTYVRAQ